MIVAKLGLERGPFFMPGNSGLFSLQEDKKMKELTNEKIKGDGIELMKRIKTGAAAACFFDPQYRGVLDRLNYGNEGVRQTGRIQLTQMSEETIKAFIKEINRVLRPSGHLFLWVDKYHLCEGISDWIKDTDLQLVDMITWDKGKMGMGYRTRRCSEYLLVLQKAPLRARGVWNDHGIRDVWQEKTGTGIHPHAKPLELQRRLIEAVTNPGDLVVDPASGSFSVLEACQQAGRDFVGGDIETGEIEL